MTSRLDTELDRLYGGSPADASGTRALVLELARPADWTALAAVWRGVQADLGLPAPAIAANGRDGLQLWFSLQQPVAPERGRTWLQALCGRYLPDLPPARLGLYTGVATGPGPAPADRAPALPAAQPEPERWSAFLASDLAPIFEDTPWLDVPPGDEGQAQLLAGLQSIAPADWARVEAALTNPVDAGAPGPMPAPPSSPPTAHVAGGPAATNDPRAFLLAVMNDPAQPMALRIEAAKALLPGAGAAASSGVT